MMLIINKNGYDENKVKNQRYYEACSGLLVSFGIEMNCYHVILKYNRLFWHSSYIFNVTSAVSTTVILYSAVPLLTSGGRKTPVCV